jgi:hypothetical protein
MYRCIGCSTYCRTEKGWKQHIKSCKKEEERVSNSRKKRVLEKTKEDERRTRRGTEEQATVQEVLGAKETPKPTSVSLGETARAGPIQKELQVMSI